MLVLTRRLNEAIVVDDDVIITVLQIKGGKIRLGITAPRDVPVVRSEIASLPPRTQPSPEVVIRCAQ